MAIKINKSNKRTIDSSENDQFSPELEKILEQEKRGEFNLDSVINEKQKKKIKILKWKKRAIFVSFIIFFIGTLIFAIYNTFFYDKLTAKEIGILSNQYNGRTNFPVDGIQGFLNYNIEEIFIKKLEFGKTTKELKFKDPVITNIAFKTDNISNVYFYIDVETNISNERIMCMLPVIYSERNYYPGGEVIITAKDVGVNNSKIQDNPNMSFSGIPKSDNDKNEEVSKFIANFFDLFYTGKDISPYYKGESKINSDKMKYIGMKNFQIYNGANNNGFNAIAVIEVELPNGITYLTEKYLLIEPEGNTWLIKGIL